MNRTPRQRGQRLDAMSRLEALRAAMDDVTRAELAVVKAKHRLRDAVVAAKDSAGAVRVARVLGVTRTRVYQIVGSVEGDT